MYYTNTAVLWQASRSKCRVFLVFPAEISRFPAIRAVLARKAGCPSPGCPAVQLSFPCQNTGKENLWCPE